MPMDDIVNKLRMQADVADAFPMLRGKDSAMANWSREAADEIERWRELAIHAWCHMGIDATCSDDDCEQCQAIKKAWENK